VLVHNDALLDWGASLSISSTPADVARSVRGILESIASGGMPAPMTPLSESAVVVNPGVPRASGAAAQWVLRAAD
jgi:hypothetical protein